MRSRETMVGDVPIIIFIEKLKKLQVLAEDRFLFAPLRKKLDTIVNELEQILIFLEQENATSELMDQLLPILYSAEYIIESFLIKTRRRRKKGVANKINKVSLFVFATWSQLLLSCKMKEIEKRIKAVSSTYDETHSNSPQHHYDETVDWNAQALGLFERPSNSPQHHYDETLDLPIGREDTEEELVRRLIKDKEESLRVISLVSEESLGKTALAKKVYNRLQIRQHFQCRVWVHVPEDFAHVPEGFTYKDLLLIIIAQIPIRIVKDVERMDEDQLSDMLFQFFMEVKFLIVLDNVASVDVWHKLVHPFGDAANGSRVILTTRNADVASQVDPWSTPVDLVRLTDEDSWALFLNKVKVGTPEENNGFDNLNSFRVKILRLCDGMPPAIILLGGVLSTMEVSEWSSVIDHLSHLCGEDDHSVPLSSILALSYRKLPVLLRPCFLYLALFPKMYEIPIRRLLHLWLAEGFVQISTKETSVVREPEDMAQVFLNELVCRNMIEIATRKLDGSPKTCRLPCFLHDVFLSKAADIGFLHVHHCKLDCTHADSPNNNFFIHRLADQYGGVKSTSESHTHNLCSYLLFEIQKRNTSNTEVEALLKRIMYGRKVALLKVIDLESIYRPVLLGKLGELKNLTYIGLRWTGLDSCPASIGDLLFLETLDLKYTNITTLPSSIWKAKKLRHLYMNEVSIPKPSKEPSIHLQTLVGLRINSKDPDGYGLTRLTNLRKLRLTCPSEALKGTVNCISGFGNLQTLKLRSRDPFGQPSDIDLDDEFKVPPSVLSLSLFGVIKDDIANLPQNLKTLTLSMSQLKEAHMRQLGQLPQLNILSLLARSYSGKKMEYCEGTFPELRVLKLWKLENLEEWGVEEGGLPKLEEMEIRGCEELKKFEGSEHLGALKELVLTNMPKDFVEAVKKMCVKEKLVTNEWRVDEKVNERAASSSSLVCSSSEEFDSSHDQQLVHQLKITLEQRDTVQEELDDLRAKLADTVQEELDDLRAKLASLASG